MAMFFRTDLRLRPDPRSTPLAMSVAAALTYYETVGQNWERAALIKARPVAGDRLAAQRFLTRSCNPLSGASISTLPRSPTSIRSSVRSRHTRAARESRWRVMTSRSAAAASARSSSSPRRSSSIWGGRLRQSAGGANLQRAALACDDRPHRRADCRHADCRLPLSAPRRAPPADGRGRADAPPAIGSGRHRRAGGVSRLCERRAVRGRSAGPSRLGREALCRAVRGNAEPVGARQPGLHRRGRRSRHARHFGAARLCRPGAGRGDGARLASRSDARDPQPAGARDPDRVRPRALTHFRHDRAS